MRRAARGLLIAALCSLLFWPARGAHANNAVILEVWPFEGHAGDTFYLSGSGYLPNNKLSFLVACPNRTDPNVWRFHNWELYEGPTTNENGDFSGFAISGFALNGIASSPCEITANYLTPPPDLTRQLFVCTHCGLYYIVPRGKALPARARSIAGRVTATPQKVRAGVHEKISVTQSWGGATARVFIRYPHQKRRLITEIHLNWRGVGERTVLIDNAAAQQPGIAGVSVAFSLGDKQGGANTTFTVVR